MDNFTVQPKNRLITKYQQFKPLQSLYLPDKHLITNIQFLFEKYFSLSLYFSTKLFCTIPQNLYICIAFEKIP